MLQGRPWHIEIFRNDAQSNETFNMKPKNCANANAHLSQMEMSRGMFTRVQNSFRCSMSFSGAWLAYISPSAVKMPMCARSKPMPDSNSAMSSLKYPRTM